VRDGANIYWHIPIPIPVPYPLFELSCAVVSGHRHITAKKEKIRRKREERTFER
jgi:hypothetical protein